MSRSTVERLKDARSFAHTAEFRLVGLDRELFPSVGEIKYTIYYCLIGVGEALKEIPADVFTTEPHIPWASIVGMRNRLVHTYWRIDDDLVYEVVTHELPALGAGLERLIKLFS